MRSYPLNSPQAAARIVALAMLADGNLSKAELDALAESGAEAQLGLRAGEWHDVVDAFCEDLMSNTHQTLGGACKIDPRALTALMAEVEDDDLRRKVLDLCVSVVDADAEIVEEEMIVLCAAAKHWAARSEIACAA
ncbi:TerB family tellurite resistance protein [Uliginosibacterium sp. H3]|uniref:TerB family tellurite resistance protein n=1 Tax=Uliginosibacterium silvisoli TaxID=3114758 RepID=A0ABU6K0G6_9RHOO|nr:TerB family tellurite resistance protein [Uliginosibacterium sp. H3]